jgi:hypothetical protein
MIHANASGHHKQSFHLAELQTTEIYASIDLFESFGYLKQKIN